MLAKAVSTPDFCSMSFLKVERKSSGTYLRIIESYRDDQGQTRHRIVHSLGKVEDYTPEQLQQIGIRLYELGGGDIKALLEGNTEEVGRYNYGYYQIYRKAFKYYEPDHLIRRIAARWKVSFDLDSAVMLMLLERLQEPCSKRSNYANQLDYAGLEPVYLQHLYRALDKLAAENKLIQQQIFQTGRDLFNQTLDVVFYDVTKYNNKSIIATYSENRAAKDKYEREQKLKTANTLLKNPSLIKKKASRYFIKQQSEDSYELDTEKIRQNEKYDGLLAISTNTANLSHQQVLEQYKQLFKIEHTFRTFKSHLETRPIFHWTNRRIEGHICLCYIAYTLQHWVLKTLSKFPIPITENILRKMLDSMQVSLIQHNDKKIYLRSAQQPYEAKLQQALGLKPLPPLIAKDSLINYL